MNFLDDRLPMRFWDKCIPEPNSGCWLWMSSIGKNGYGYFHLDSKNQLTHRIAYLVLVGPIPFGLDIDHLCRTRNCCNPAHLEPVTRSVNARRGDCGKANAAAQRAKTHCRNGHPFEGDNLYVNPSGHRGCRLCARIAKGRHHGVSVG